MVVIRENENQDDTIDKLIEMCLATMEDTFRNWVNGSKFKEIPFEGCFGMLSDYSGIFHL